MSYSIKLGVFFLSLISITSACQADPLSFSQSKKQLAKFYESNPRTFYCGCSYSKSLKAGSKHKYRLQPSWSSCGYQPRKQAKRASRIEWEHIMPAHHFGQHMQCWRKGGRKACKKDKQFRLLEGDMHNLVPAVGEVNGDRSNFKYGMIAGEKRVYGQCDAEVDFKAKRFEPAPSVRGDIARAYFYMSHHHHIKLSKQQIQMFDAWSKQDPVDDFERAKNEFVRSVQGNSNPYIQ